MLTRRSFLQSSSAAAAFAASASSARAENAPGVTDTEIKIGQTMPYSGPASAYGVIGRTETAYFKMINEQGGINGRKINLISLDDGYSPPRTVEQVRRLVEEEKVAFLFNTLGTPPNLAIRPYCNEQQDTSAVRRHRRRHVQRPEAIFLDHGLSAELPDRSQNLRQAHPEDQARRQDRRALPERRLRQGLSHRAQGGSRRGPCRHGDQGSLLRGFRADGRFADRHAAGLGGRCVPHRRDAQIRRPGDPQGLSTSAGSRCAT